MLNGAEVSAARIRGIVGFVSQDDALLETFTVEETFTFAAEVNSFFFCQSL